MMRLTRAICGGAGTSLRALALALVLTAAPLLAVAAQGTPPAAPATASGTEPAPDFGELELLLRTLERPEEREQFLQRLRTLIETARQGQPREGKATEPESLGARALELLSERISAVGAQVGQTAEIVVALPKMLESLWLQAQRTEARNRWLEVLGKLALVLAVGLAAERLLIRLLARPRRSVEIGPEDPFGRRALLFVARALLEVAPIVGFAVAAYITLPLTEPSKVTRLIALAVINANVLARAISVVARLLLAPRAAPFRILPVADETANYAYIWVRRLTVVGVYGYFFAEATLLLGLSYGAYQFLLKAVGLVVAGMLVVLVLQNRAGVAARLRGEAQPGAARRGLRARLGDSWHVLAIVYVLGCYGVWALEISGGFEFLLRATLVTFVIVGIAQLASFGITRLLDRGFRLSDELRERFPDLEVRANRYLPVLQRILRTAIWLLALLGLLEVWGLGGLAWLGTEAGRAIAARLLTILLVVGAAFLLWELTGTAIEAYLRRRERAAEPGTGKRLLTLLPLLRNAMRVVLGVLVIMIVLSELGVDIAPLLAGAGVVGLAVGFGAQTLVKDVITGVFILLEESIRVGDVVNVGGHAGIVERITIRTVVLRDLDGAVHVIPFGGIASIRNMTMGFAYAFMEVGIAYREDVDQVIEVLREVGAELQADAAFGPDILEPLEVLGLDSFGDSAVNIRIRFKTLPIKQWRVRREFNRRMKRVFDQRGIEIPFPHQTIYFGVDKQSLAPPARILREPRSAAEAPETGEAGPAPKAADRPSGAE